MTLHHPIPDTTGLAQPFGADPKTYAVAGMTGHNGLDFAAPIGTPVHAVREGRVLHAGPGDTGPFAFLLGNAAGLAILIEHDLPLDAAHAAETGGRGTTITGYAHLSRLDVTAGEDVETGQVIGGAGETGWVGGPHLHFEVLPLDQDRAPYLTNGYLGRVEPLRILRYLR